MDRYQYLLLLVACLVVTLPLEVVLRADVYRRWRRAAIVLVPVVVLFVAWDVVAIAWRHWRYNPRYVTGWELPGRLPVEELAFFVVIPLCGLLTFEAVRRLRGR